MKKEKITLEYPVPATTQSIFRALSTAGGLKEWFADNVDVSGSVITFFWNKTPHIAHVISKKENHHIRFKWIDESESYFEFRIIQNELIGINSLIITDFADEAEVIDTVELWDNQIEKLKRSIGCAKN